MDKNYYAVIMAGGIGSRFWPLSKETKPKQFLDLLGSGKTLIQKTYERLTDLVPSNHIFVLTNSSYTDLVQSELPQITQERIIPEPDMRNTAPCILFSALKIHKENPDAFMVIAPSDHWIEDEKAFSEDIKSSFEACTREDILMTLGIKPSFPHTGYGYIAFDKSETNAVKSVEQFTEKPDYQTAQSFLESGNYLWNAGIFIAKVSTLLEAFQKHLPEMYDLFYKGMDALNTPAEKDFLFSEYGKAQNISFDYGIMEKADNVKVLPASFDWNDLGSWGSLYDKKEKDNNGNVVIETEAFIENSHDNIIRIPKGKTLVLKDLNGYIIVENEEILLIYPKDKEQEIKEIRNKVLKAHGEHLG